MIIIPEKSQRKFLNFGNKKRIIKVISNFQKFSFNKDMHSEDEMIPKPMKFKRKIVKKLLEMMERRKAQMMANLGHLENV